MYKIIGLLFVSYFIAIEARLNFPIQSNDGNLPKAEKIDYRLTDKVTPNNYKIKLTTYLLDEDEQKRSKFDGYVEIDLTVKEDVDNIAFHAKNLQFSYRDIALYPENSETPINNIAVEGDTVRDLRYVKPVGGEKIRAGDYILKIKYIGSLNNGLQGFYNSSYTNDKGEKIMLATTQFEPVGARLAFPCFDEPAFKATFDLTIVHDTSYHAISNTKAKSTKGGVTIFETTPKMSTYLVAFIVSDFGELSMSTVHGHFKVHARKNAIRNGFLALDESEKILTELEQVTGINFPIDKMDQAAIPNFSAGAMENWGLVTYREQSLLFERGVTTASQKQGIVETIAHEFAHQWFGDLVSPKWWKYTWLNEGFATFFQSYITERVHPSWQSVYQSVVKSIQTTAFDVDSSPSTRPLNHDVGSPAEISSKFDSISYQKGGSVIRMMQHFLTDAVFRNGLTDYLKNKAYDVAESDDLFEALTKASNIDVKEIMDNWVNQKGYPVVTLTRNYNTYTLKQERFFSYVASDEEKKNQTLWYIPINIARSNRFNFDDTKPEFWLAGESKEVELTDFGPTEAIILNKQQTGYYRVNYDESNWNNIATALVVNRTQIHELNRAQIVNDALAFVKQGMMNLTTLMKLTDYLKDEDSYFAWYPGFKTFTWLNSKLVNSEHYPFFKEHILRTTKNLIDKLKYEDNENESPVTKFNRIAALNLACTLGNQECHDIMQEKLQEWLNDEKNVAISPDLKPIVLCNGLRSANLTLWNAVEHKSETSSASERGQYIRALGCSEDPMILNYYLNKSLKKQGENIVSVIDTVSENSEAGPDVVLQFLVRNSIDIYRRVGKNDAAMSRLFTKLSTKFTTPAQLKKLKEATDNGIPEDLIVPAIETASKNIEWVQKNERSIIAWKNGIKEQ